MNINKKIEELRKAPEHVRLRYVWIAVAITMFFVVIIWLFSIGEKLQVMPPPESDSSLQNKLDEAKNNMPSLQDYLKNSGATTDGSPANEISPEQTAPAGVPENGGQN